MPYIKGKYFTDSEVQQAMSQLSPDEREKVRRHISSSSSSGEGDFLLSAVVGFATGSGVIGGLVGGSLLGGIIGDELEGSDDSIF